MKSRWSEPLIVAAVICAVFVPFMGKAYHIDEPYFLHVAREFLQHPSRPFDFVYNYWGWPTTYAHLNNHPPLVFWLLALALKSTGGGEWAMRLALLPVDIAAGLGLYLLASRFLRRPLLPTLIIIATPAYLINMNHLMAEKPAVAFGLWALYALVRSVQEDDERWFWASALLLDLAMLCKYDAVMFLAPALIYARHRRRLWAYAALSVAGPSAYVGYTHFTALGGLAEPWHDVTAAYARPWSAWPHKLRSLLAFLGGCGIVTAVWPFLVVRPQPALGLAGAAAVAALFLPWLDIAPVVLPVDRLTGAALSLGAAWGLWQTLRGYPGARGRWLWASWLAFGLPVAWFYPSVSARLTLLLIPPSVLAAAEALESAVPADVLRRWHAASLAAVAAFSLTLACVDFRYAAVQREFADQAALQNAGGSGRLWNASVLGLSHYLSRAGALSIDRSQGGWRQVRRGDLVISSLATRALGPELPVHANVARVRVDYPLPLRLISFTSGEAGFYSNSWGFLPYSFSAEPLEEFTQVEILDAPVSEKEAARWRARGSGAAAER